MATAADLTVLEGSSAALSAAGSTDPDGGGIVEFAWTQTSGPSVTLDDPSSASPSFTAPLTEEELVLEFRVTVTDDEGASASTDVAVTVRPSSAPIADAGVEQETIERETVVLSGTGSTDPDGSDLSFHWVQVSGAPVALDAPQSAKTSFTAPETATLLSLRFELTVTDETGDNTSDTVGVDVHPNAAPSFETQFPCGDCRFFGASIAVAGTAEPGADDDFVLARDEVSVFVDAGAGVVEAQVEADGAWLATDLPLPTDAAAVTIEVTVRDAFGESVSGSFGIAVRPTLTAALIATDPASVDRVYMLEDGNPRDRLLELDSSTDRLDVLFEADSLIGGVGTNFTQPWDVALDSSRGRLLILDITARTLEALHLADGSHTVVSSDTNGAGVAFASPRRVVVRDGAEAIVLDTGIDGGALLSVDLTSGDRSLVSANAGPGTGESFVSPEAMTIDPDAGLGYVVQGEEILEVDLASGDRSILSPSGVRLDDLNSVALDGTRSTMVGLRWRFDGVVTVDLNTGERVLLSDPGTSGIELGNPRQLEVDEIGDRYIVNDFSQNPSSGDVDALVVVDPGSGERSLMVTDRVGSGPALDGARPLDVEPETAVAYTLARTINSLIEVDLVTGARELVSGPTLGSGNPLDSVVDIVVDAPNTRVLALDRSDAAVIEVDLTSGDRAEVSGSSVGGGPSLVRPEAMVMDADGAAVLVTDSGLEALLEVDLVSGDRTIVSDSASAGPSFDTPLGLGLDDANGRVIVADQGDGGTARIKILAVDLTSGVRTEISSTNVGDGPNFRDAVDVEVHSASRVALVTEGSRILRVDLANGNRTLLASSDVGNGESVINVRRIALDAAREVLYGVSGNFEALFAFDVRSGDRVILSK